MGFLTTGEYATIIMALKDYKRKEQKDALYFSQLDGEEMKQAAESYQKNAEEAETVIKKLDNHILELLIMEE